MALETVVAEDLKQGDILHLDGTTRTVIEVNPDNRFPRWPGVIVRINEVGHLVFRLGAKVEIETQLERQASH